MDDLPHPWGAYALRQAELDRNKSVDDKAWGLEAGLNLIVASDHGAGEPTEEAINRAVSSRGRLERWRRVRHVSVDDAGEVPDPTANLNRIDAYLQTARTFALVERQASNLDWDALYAVAIGDDYRAIAARHGATPGALRVRVTRMRRLLRQFAA